MADRYEEINKHIADKDDHIIIPITRGYIQQFVKDNYGRELTESELEELSEFVWDDGDYDLMSWIDATISQIIEESKQKKKK